jgi:hypothetical protein
MLAAIQRGKDSLTGCYKYYLKIIICKTVFLPLSEVGVKIDISPYGKNKE